MSPIKTVLYPTDFSDNAEFAFELACSLARVHGARLIALHVAPPPPVAMIGGMVAVPAPPDKEMLADLDKRLRRIESSDPAVTVTHCLEQGDAVLQILKAAEDSGCELIVMGTHGRTGLSRLVMGSIAEEVVRKAPCPVLTVKMPIAAATPKSRETTAAR